MDSGSTVKDFGVLAGSATVCRSRMQGSGVDIGVETCANVHAEGNREGDSTGGAPAERAAKRRRLLGDDGTDYFSEGAESPGTVRTGSFSPQERRAQLVLVEKMSRYARGSVVPHARTSYVYTASIPRAPSTSRSSSPRIPSLCVSACVPLFFSASPGRPRTFTRRAAGRRGLLLRQRVEHRGKRRRVCLGRHPARRRRSRSCQW